MDTEKILGIYDNGGRTFDRYTVVYNEHFTWDKTDGLFVCLGMSGNPFHPQGFAQHSSAMVGPHLRKQITDFYPLAFEVGHGFVGFVFNFRGFRQVAGSGIFVFTSQIQ